MPERLQKILAQSGYGSRRASEDFISAGRVRNMGTTFRGEGNIRIYSNAIASRSSRQPTRFENSESKHPIVCNADIRVGEILDFAGCRQG